MRWPVSYRVEAPSLTRAEDAGFEHAMLPSRRIAIHSSFRQRIEWFLGEIKGFKDIDTCYGKINENYTTLTPIVATVIRTRLTSKGLNDDRWDVRRHHSRQCNRRKEKGDYDVVLHLLTSIQQFISSKNFYR